MENKPYQMNSVYINGTRRSATTGFEYETVSFPVSVKMTLVIRDNHKCVFCNLNFRTYPFLFTVDHVIPRSLGGKHEQDNLVSACYYCNIARGYRTFQQSKDYINNRLYKRLKSLRKAKKSRTLKKRNKWLKSMYYYERKTLLKERGTEYFSKISKLKNKDEQTLQNPSETSK